MKKILLTMLIITFIYLGTNAVNAFEKTEELSHVDILIDNYTLIDKIEIYELYQGETYLQKELEKQNIENSTKTKIIKERIIQYYPEIHHNTEGYQLPSKFFLIIKKINGNQIDTGIFMFDFEEYSEEFVYSTESDILEKRNILYRRPSFNEYVQYLAYLFVCGVIAFWVRMATSSVMKIEPMYNIILYTFVINLITKIAVLLMITYLIMSVLMCSLVIVTVFTYLEYLFYLKKYREVKKRDIIIFTSIANLLTLTGYVFINLYFNNLVQ